MEVNWNGDDVWFVDFFFVYGVGEGVYFVCDVVVAFDHNYVYAVGWCICWERDKVGLEWVVGSWLFSCVDGTQFLDSYLWIGCIDWMLVSVVRCVGYVFFDLNFD